MPLYFASDHAAVNLKNHLLEICPHQGHTVCDLTPEENPATHYSEAADRVADKLLGDNTARDVGVLLCGTGQGTLMRANRHKGVRAALVASEYHAEMARKHNDANIIVFGARLTTPDMAQRYLDIFLRTEFEGGRHQPRVASIDAPLNQTE